MRRFLIPLYMLLGACVPVTDQDTATRAVSVIETSDLPAIKTFAVPRPPAPMAANSDIARDFLDLAFSLESGRQLAMLTRFDGPITVRVTGSPPATLPGDLNRLLFRLRTEAGLPITLTGQDDANVTIAAIPRAEIRRTLPQAACFVVPNVSSLREYRLARRSSKVNWSRLERRTRVAIFLPSDASPQEVRDCLHEELAQSLGPLNDLYRLPDSVFNDDNVHTVLTGYDMLILRVFYDPALRNGMRRSDVAAQLPQILARINPAGEALAPTRLGRTPRSWIDAVQVALGPGSSPAERMQAAQNALQIAEASGWTDHRRGFAHYAMGRLIQSSDARAAKSQFEAAQRYFGNRPQTRLHQAYVASQLSAYDIRAGDGAAALQMLTPHIKVAAQHENAALLATLMMLRAEALELTGQTSEGRQVRMDSLGWARYGFGPDWAVRAKLREIAALNPLKRRSGAI